MASNEHELKRAAGMDENTDVAIGTDKSSVLMLGVSSRYPGVMEPLVSQKNLAGLNGNVLGMFYYLGADSSADRLIVLYQDTGSASYYVYKYVITATINATFGTMSISADGGTLVTNSSGTTLNQKKRVRICQFGSELIFTQEGGCAPFRFNGTALYKLGITAPAVPTSGGTSATGLTGTYQWWVTYADEFGRESNPSPALTATLANQKQVVNWTAPSDAQVQTIYLYRTAASGIVGYRVVEAGFSAATTTYTDSVDDTTLQAHTSSPRSYENSVPDSASWCHVWKNRLALNSTVNTRRVQISNLASPSQFSLENDARYPSDGQTRTVYTNLGDEITGLYSIGSALGVFSRKSITVIVGDSPANFQFRAPQRIGCTSPDTLAELDGATWFRSDDGIYAATFEGGFNVQCMSDQIDRQFQMLRVPYPWEKNDSISTVWFTQGARQSSAISACLSNKYHLSQPPYDCIFDSRTKQWAMQPMIGMPWSTTGYSYGYSAMCMGSVGGRAYDVLFISPGDLYTSSSVTNPGQVFARAVVPITAEEELYPIQYITRAVDGAGVPRNSNKTISRITVFGEGVDTGNLYGLTVSVYYDRDPNYSFQWGTAPQKVDYSVTLTASEIAYYKREGILCRVDVNAPPARIMCVGVKATSWSRPFDIRDILVEYVRQDSA